MQSRQRLNAGKSSRLAAHPGVHLAEPLNPRLAFGHPGVIRDKGQVGVAGEAGAGLLLAVEHVQAAFHVRVIVGVRGYLLLYELEGGWLVESCEVPAVVDVHGCSLACDLDSAAALAARQAATSEARSEDSPPS